MPSFDSFRRSLSEQSAEVVTLSDLMMTLRFLGVLAVIGGALAAYLWSRMEVTRMAVALDEARSELSRADMLNERLMLERQLLRQPGRLAEEAQNRGMVPPVVVIEMEAVPNP